MPSTNEVVLAAVAVGATALIYRLWTHRPAGPKTGRGDTPVVGSGATAAQKRERLLQLKRELEELIRKRHCAPILVRFAWHDSGTFDDRLAGQWPVCGGANGSIRFDAELKHNANAGLSVALNLLKPIKAAYPDVSWADIIQMASATAIEVAGGPAIPMRYGRLDAAMPEDCPKEGNLPDAHPDGSPAAHLRRIFHRMGFTDQEIVVLSGGHTLGRAFKDRSGAAPLETTRFTAKGPGRHGGQPWTEKWLSFSNDYFVNLFDEKRDSELLVLPTDQALTTDPYFRRFAKLYAEDKDAFYVDYAAAHKKLSELGSRFEPAEGIKL